MNNVGYGYVWPSLSFSSDWQSIHIRSRPTTRWEAEPIRYLSHFDFSVSIGDFVDSIDDFIDGTITRLFHVQNGVSQLSMLWDEVREERRDPGISELRILESCIGYDPDEVPDYHIECVVAQLLAFSRREYKLRAIRIHFGVFQDFNSTVAQRNAMLTS